MTTTRYIDWMMDSFAVAFHQSHYPTRISVNFMRETNPGDSIRLVRQEWDGQAYDFEGQNTTQGVTAFLGRVSVL